MIQNRIDGKFKELRDRKKKAFIAFITAGDPDLKTTEELVLSFEKAGVDIIELGVPFSDPLADGPTIQAASQRAIEKGVNLKKIFGAVSVIRKTSQIPIALMSYYNPIFHYGEKQFIVDAKKAGVDGLIIPDLPPEEAVSLVNEAKKNYISTVFFLAPTTKEERINKIIRSSTGFIYYVSLTGVTGARVQVPSAVLNSVKKAKGLTNKPVCVGFGISDASHVRKIASIADGVIVGSAIINRIVKNKNNKNLVKNVSAFVRTLTKVL